MSSQAKITKRPLKNKATGIDMSVPSHEQAPSPRQVKNYHVVVITRLPFFKKPEHSEEDVLQFMVPRDYEAFETLQSNLVETYPDLKLPSLPRKFHVFLSKEDLDERQFSFDCLLKVIAQDPEKCASTPILRFLGVKNLLADVDYKRARAKYLRETRDSGSKASEGAEDEELDELFGGGGGEKEKDKEELDDLVMPRNTSASGPYSAASIFDDVSMETKQRGAAARSVKGPTLLADEGEEEEEGGGDLFIPRDTIVEGGKAGGPPGGGGEGGGSVYIAEDNSELLSVSDNLDDVLKIVSSDKGKTAQKAARTTSKSSVPTSTTASGLFDEEEEEKLPTDQLGSDDILKYIQQNQVDPDDDLELF